MKLSVILPTRNEEETIFEVIKRLSKIKPKPYEIIISDFSQDRTKEVAKKAFEKFKIRGKIIDVKQKGKGIAIKKAFEFVEGDLIVIIDADLNYLPEDIPRLLKYKEYDIVQPKRKRLDSFTRKLLGKIFHFLVLLLFGLSIDTQCALKLVRKEVIKKIKIKTNGFCWDVEFLYLAKKYGFKIYNGPIVSYSTRSKGKSKIKFSTPLEMFIELLKIRIRTL